MLLTEVQLIQPNMANVQLDTLMIDGIGWKAYWDDPERKLRIEDILFKNPYFSFAQGADSLREKLSASRTSIKKQIQEAVAEIGSELQIGRIHFENGKFIYQLKDKSRYSGYQKAQEISLTIKEIKVKKDMNDPSNFLFSQDIVLDVSDYKFDFPNAPGTIMIKHISASRADSSVVLDSVVYSDPGKLSLVIPQIITSEINWKNYWHRESMDIGSLIFQSPQLEMRSEGKKPVKENKKLNWNEMAEKINEVFPSLNIRMIVIQSGTFDKRKIVGNSESIQQANNVAVTFNNFHIDSTSAKQIGQFLFADNIRIRLNNYLFIPPDSSFSIRTSWMEGNIVDTSLAFHNTTLIKDSTVKVHIPLIEIGSVGLQKYLETNDLKISRLEFTEPEIAIRKVESKHRKGKKTQRN